jgi:hypothetical protein
MRSLLCDGVHHLHTVASRSINIGKAELLCAWASFCSLFSRSRLGRHRRVLHFATNFSLSYPQAAD